VGSVRPDRGADDSPRNANAGRSVQTPEAAPHLVTHREPPQPTSATPAAAFRTRIPSDSTRGWPLTHNTGVESVRCWPRTFSRPRALNAVSMVSKSCCSAAPVIRRVRNAINTE
jgi:hypothetical protein